MVSYWGGTAEVADVLDCPRQQIHSLRKRADFPAPYFILKATPVWFLPEVRAWGTTWKRRKKSVDSLGTTCV